MSLPTPLLAASWRSASRSLAPVPATTSSQTLRLLSCSITSPSIATTTPLPRPSTFFVPTYQASTSNQQQSRSPPRSIVGRLLQLQSNAVEQRRASSSSALLQGAAETGYISSLLKGGLSDRLLSQVRKPPSSFTLRRRRPKSHDPPETPLPPPFDSIPRTPLYTDPLPQRRPKPEPPQEPDDGPFLTRIIRKINRIPETAVLTVVALLNFLVFVCYQFAQENWIKHGNPNTYLFMWENFSSGWKNLLEGRWWTLITSSFSQEDSVHLLMNMLSLAFMAPPVLSLLKPFKFLCLYLGAGVMTSVTSLIWHGFLDPRLKDPMLYSRVIGTQSLGASGAVYAVMATFACLRPKATFLLFFVVPVPAWACVSGIFAWDLINATLFAGRTNTDGAGHIGGMMTGALYYYFRLRTKRL